MPPRTRPIWRPRSRSVPVPVQANDYDGNANVHANLNPNIHIHILPRVPGPVTLPAPKFDNTSVSVSNPSSSTPISAPSTSTDPTLTQTSSLWSSSYGYGTGVKIAGMIDAGLVLILLVFFWVIFIQWKKRIGSVDPIIPSNTKPKADGDQEQDAGVLVQVDSHGNEKKKVEKPALVARSGSGSEEEHDNENMRRSDLEEGFLGLTVPGQKKGEEMKKGRTR